MLSLVCSEERKTIGAEGGFGFIVEHGRSVSNLDEI